MSTRDATYPSKSGVDSHTQVLEAPPPDPLAGIIIGAGTAQSPMNTDAAGK